MARFHLVARRRLLLVLLGGALTLWLQQGVCVGSSSLTLAEVKPSWGRAQQTLLTGHEYSNPPAGFFVSLSLSLPRARREDQGRRTVQASA